MVKTNQTETVSQPTEEAAKLPEDVIAEVQAMPEETAELIAIETRRKGKGLLETEMAAVTEAFRNKATTLQTVRQKLAEVADMASESEELSGKALEQSSEAAALLYQAWRNSVVDKNEVSALLGDLFGWRKKGDSKTKVRTGDKDQSATPFGPGETIRKRIVRAYNAAEYVATGDCDSMAFFEPIEQKDVAAALNEFHDGKASIDKLFKTLSDLKAEATGTRPKAAFDPNRIAALAKQMGENVNNTADAILTDAGLRAAYRSLLQIIQTVSAVAADKLDEKDAA